MSIVYKCPICGEVMRWTGEITMPRLLRQGVDGPYYIYACSDVTCDYTDMHKKLDDNACELIDKFNAVHTGYIITREQYRTYYET